MYSASNPKDNNDTSANVLYFNLMALCHSQVILMLSTDINITENTYSCQFQYEFGNQGVLSVYFNIRNTLPM